MVTQTSPAIQVIKLRRHKVNGSFGFSLRGGCEHGTGFYISDVEFGSEAEHKGLKVGDQVLRVNGFTVDRAIHQELLSVIKCKDRLALKVKHVGMVPVKNHKCDPLTWRMIEATNDFIYNLQRRDIVETEVFIDGANGPNGLGCSIANGPAEKPGIFVQTTKVGGLAHEAGLRTGDQILRMNDKSLDGLSFSEAVSMLKASSNLKLIVLKSVGLDLFVPSLGHNGHELEIPNCNRFGNDGVPFIGQRKIRTNQKLNSSQSDDTSSQNSSIHLSNGEERDVSSSMGTRSSLSDDVHASCSSSDDAGSLTSSETYGRSLSLSRWNETDSVDSMSSVKKEQEKLAEDRRRLEIEQNKLKEQSEILLKEKEKLEEDKKKHKELAIKPPELPAPPDMKPFVMPQKYSTVNFFKELKEKSDAREQRNSEASSNASTNSSRMGSPREMSKSRGFSTDSDAENISEDYQKRRQHEKLMMEFREAHKKMFKKSQSESDESASESSVEKEKPETGVSAIKPDRAKLKEKNEIGEDVLKIAHQTAIDVGPKTKIDDEKAARFQINANDCDNKALRRNMKCPAPPPPPTSYKIDENIEPIPIIPEKRVTILPEATNIMTCTNKEEKARKSPPPNKVCNGILKKTGQSYLKNSTDTKKATVKATKFTEDVLSEDKINYKKNLSSGSIIDTNQKSTVRVTISSYPNASIQPNRFAPKMTNDNRRNLTTRVNLNGLK